MRPPAWVRKSDGAVRRPHIDIRSFEALGEHQLEYMDFSRDDIDAVLEARGRLRPGRFLMVHGDEIESYVPKEPLYELHPDGPRGVWSAVYEAAWYLRAEERYDFVPYNDQASVAWVFVNQSRVTGHYALKGAALFDRPNDSDEWWLAWVWIHPLDRRQGLLTQAWPVWREVYGDFPVQAPHSPGMRQFLINDGYYERKGIKIDPRFSR